MSDQKINDTAWLEQINGETFAIIRVKLDGVNRPEIGAIRREMDDTARAILVNAFPADWQAEADRLAGLYKQTRDTVQAADKQIRALQNERNNLFTASTAAGADFDRIDEMEAKAELRKDMAVKRLSQFRPMVEAHGQKLFHALLASPANTKLIRGEYLEADGLIQSTLVKICQAIKPVADNIARQTVRGEVYKERRGSYTTLASALSSEWASQVLAN